MEFNGGNLSADHLCVLVHGLWGNPNHMRSVAKALRAAHSEDKVYILVPNRNSGSFTYDGIERGGERLCLEIEEELEKIKSNGGNITKLSFVGYSAGGLVARYAVGLLYANGMLDQLEPVNFTTFATPHLGARTPLGGWKGVVWNGIGVRTLSHSGKQLFIVDKFRDTGRPLLSILTEPNSIFMSGLKKFKRLTLYSNIVNDRTAVHYTTMISKTDPYVDMTKVKPNCVAGYDDIILDPDHPFTPVTPKSTPTTMRSVTRDGIGYIKQAPTVVAFAVFIPVGVTAFLLNSVVQTLRSSRRIRLHEMGLAGIEIDRYRMPIWIKDIRGTVEEAYENLSSSQGQSYLSSSEDEGELGDSKREVTTPEPKQPLASAPTLALEPCQFSMISSLDKLAWRKYPVWIHNVRHSHAAIIVRSTADRYHEGYVVLRHWLDEEFLV